MIFKVVLLIMFFLKISNCANILIATPIPSFSHQISFRQVWKSLSLRGHKVTLITTDPENDSSLPNLREIDVRDAYNIWDDKHKFSSRAQEGFSIWEIWDVCWNMGNDILEHILTKSQIQELIYNKEKFNFDVIIAELGYPEVFAFSKIYNCPSIIAGTIGSTFQMNHYLGNPTHPAIHSDMNLPYAEHFTFKERLISTVFNWHILYSEYFKILPMKQRILDKFFGNYTNVTVTELNKNVDLMLVNLNPVFHGPRALGPTTVYIGGGLHMKPPTPLPEDLKEYLDNAKDGFIYFSLGGNVKSRDMKGSKMDAIIKTFKDIPYKVLWKFEADDLPGKPENVKIVKWAPQQDVLRHPNIKLFISHAGMFSIEEAIFSHVPLIVMPFFGDQLKNARIVEAKGIGKIVEHNPVLNQEAFRTAILEVTSDVRYKDSVEKLALLMQDQPMTGLQLAVWWIEYVIRHKGAKHLRNPVVDLPLYQYYLLDVFGFLLLIIVSTVIITVFVLKRFVHLTKLLLLKLTRTNKPIKTE